MSEMSKSVNLGKTRLFAQPMLLLIVTLVIPSVVAIKSLPINISLITIKEIYHWYKHKCL